ncbi:uncharacterized protein LOC117782331 [Drosophila innubila]|uniref:uncharacterized protein LOC117782331 n=1 Tax=Drosophila innubila TaxID=198719 RepID=UPI00148C0EFE|nr:uncharacterized protein LOC117782331 [Drosophila innubila]
MMKCCHVHLSDRRQFEASSGFPNTKLTVEAPSYCSFATEDQANFTNRNSSFCLTRKISRIVRASAPRRTSCRSSCSTESFAAPGKTCCAPKEQEESPCSTENLACPIKKTCCSFCEPQSENLKNSSCYPSPMKTDCCSSSQPQKEYPKKTAFCAPKMKNSKQTYCQSTGCKTDIPKRTCHPCEGDVVCSRKTDSGSSSEKTSCCASCTNEMLLNQNKPSTINVCLKICTADGDLLDPGRITATLETPPEGPKKLCGSDNILTSTSPSGTLSKCCKNSSSKSSIFKSDCKQVPSSGSLTRSTCDCKKDCDFKNVGSTSRFSHKDSHQLETSDSCTVCSENNFINVRTDRSSSRPGSNTSCITPRVPKPILSTSKKSTSQCCTPYNKKSMEKLNWNKCPSQVKIQCKCTNKDIREEKLLCKEKSSKRKDCCGWKNRSEQEKCTKKDAREECPIQKSYPEVSKNAKNAVQPKKTVL